MKDRYVISILLKWKVTFYFSSKPKTFKLERLTGDEFIFNDDLTRYRSISQLMSAYNDPQGVIYLGECIPPSEYGLFHAFLSISFDSLFVFR